MTDTERFDRWFTPAVSRRTVLRGSLLGGVGLAAAALIGCGGDDDDDDDGGTTATTSGSGTTTASSTSSDSSDDSSDDSASDDSGSDDGDDGAAEPVGEGMLVRDPDLPYPYQFPEPSGLTPKAGGILRVAATWDVGSMDPTVSAAGGTITVPNMVYNKLLGMVGGPAKDPFSIEIKPEIASAWERTPDGTTFAFQLRDDVKWQNVAPLNGRPLVAEDVKFAFDLYSQEGVHQSYWTNIGSIDAVDDTNLTITMSKVTADFILPLASRYQLIFPKELVDEGTIDQKVIGTGAMILDEAAQGSHATFNKNPDYWEGEVFLDGVEFRLRQDYAARLAGFRVGQFDYCYGLVPDIRAMEALIGTNPDVQVNFNTNVRGNPFGLNLSNPKFLDDRVRQAITLAMDTEFMEDVQYDGLAKSNALQVWTFVFDEEPTVANGDFGPWIGRHDVAEAKKLIAAAGAEGLEFDNFYHNYGSPTGDQRSDIVKEQLAAVGINMIPRHVDYTEFNSTWVPGKLEEASTSAWATVGFDADNYFYSVLHSQSSGNRWQLNDPQVDALAEAQQVELDPDARRDILRDIWDFNMDKAYHPPLPTQFSFEVYQPWVRGLRFGGVMYSNGSYYDWGHQMGTAWLDK